MLYELIGVVRPGNIHEVKEIAKTAGKIVLSTGGIIRGYTNWGPFTLPKPTVKHQARYTQGHYFIMRFDSSGQTQQSVRSTLALDPRMIRFSVVKMGSTLQEIKDVSGKVFWNNKSMLSRYVDDKAKATEFGQEMESLMV
ncbi:MAG: hypothetical protein M1834_004764 [Cirrosporium novae-zelandiae]|nr:MAG: hypothetical protein M1834_004764 [Cirrosporium novae-zelandiae]